MISPITIFGDSNEAAHGRLADLAAAAIGDKRFNLAGVKNLVSDLRVERMPWSMNIELKDFTGEGNSDMLNSLLSGHAWKQLRDLRGAREPGCFVIPGDKKKLDEAIEKAAYRNQYSSDRNMDPDRLAGIYSNLITDFRRNCDCLGIKTFMIGEAPWFQDTEKSVWQNLLHYINKMSTGGDPFAHMPKWSKDELEVGALVDRISGLGPVRAREVAREYKLTLVPRNAHCPPELEDLPGIGPKTANLIRAELMA